MSYSYLFEPAAAKEYEDAFEWYQQRSEVAADNLIVEVEERSGLFVKILIDTGKPIKTFGRYR